jgi:hypothetical protein
MVSESFLSPSAASQVLRSLPLILIFPLILVFPPFNLVIIPLPLALPAHTKQLSAYPLRRRHPTGPNDTESSPLAQVGDAAFHD